MIFISLGMNHLDLKVGQCTDQHYHVLNALAIIKLLITWLWVKLHEWFYSVMYHYVHQASVSEDAYDTDTFRYV